MPEKELENQTSETMEKDEEDIEEEEEEEDEDEEESDSEFDDPEGYVDTISDEELLADLLKEKPTIETGFDNIIVVDNAPKVGPERMGKLKNVLNKVFSRFGQIVSQEFPLDENGIFKGYFFLEFATAEEATSAVKTGNGYRLDKSHVFAVNHFSDFDKYKDLPAVWKPPEKEEFKEVGNLRSWLLDENCYDQCAIIYNQGNQVAITQITPQEIKIATERERWTETYLRWSPQGSYLATLHKPGVALWGGDAFKRINRFEHHGVQLIDFSPCERYLVTFSNVVDDPNDPQNIIIWDIKTGKKKRSFTKGAAEDWPILKWSHDGKYFARRGENVISIYEVPSFGLLDKKSLVVKGVKDFSWSPTDYKMAYWVPEQGQIPAKIIIIEIPSRRELSTKSRHLVSECKLHWHKQGDFLCVRVDHWMTKSRKQLFYSFEIFHVRESLIPVDTIEIKEPVISFSLEPQGSLFAVIHGEPPTRISVSFYKINDKDTKLSKIRTQRCNANNIFWSPAGQFVVLAGLKGVEAGQLEFWDTKDMTIMNTAEHSSATDLEWDPTGRYIVTSVSFWTQKMDTGFYVWSFQGKPLYRSPMKLDKFCQLLWRPRPPSLLTDQDIQSGNNSDVSEKCILLDFVSDGQIVIDIHIEATWEIKQKYKHYHHIFEQKDRSIKTKASKELIEKRKKLINQYHSYRKRKEEELKQKQAKVQLGGVKEDAIEYEEETIDILEKEKTDIVE